MFANFQAALDEFLGLLLGPVCNFGFPALHSTIKLCLRSTLASGDLLLRASC
jgi:hypothetical protein